VGCGGVYKWQEEDIQITVESDSKFLIDMVTWGCKINGNTPILIRRVQDFSKL